MLRAARIYSGIRIIEPVALLKQIRFHTLSAGDPDPVQQPFMPSDMARIESAVLLALRFIATGITPASGILRIIIDGNANA